MADRRLLYRYKGDHCRYCGLSVEEKLQAFGTLQSFELHHVNPSNKARNYKNLIRRKLSSEQLNEADKCVLLCSNCHDTLHGQDRSFDLTVTLSATGIAPIRHTIRCQMLCDFRKRSVALFSEDFDYLELYRVRHGSTLDTVVSGLQLKEANRLDALIERTRFGGELLIETFNGEFMLSARRIDDQRFEIAVKGEFPLATAFVRLSNTAGKRLDLHSRHDRLIVHRPDGRSDVSAMRGRLTFKAVVNYRAVVLG